MGGIESGERTDFVGKHIASISRTFVTTRGVVDTTVGGIRLGFSDGAEFSVLSAEERLDAISGANRSVEFDTTFVGAYAHFFGAEILRVRTTTTPTVSTTNLVSSAGRIRIRERSDGVTAMFWTVGPVPRGLGFMQPRPLGLWAMVVAVGLAGGLGVTSLAAEKIDPPDSGAVSRLLALQASLGSTAAVLAASLAIAAIAKGQERRRGMIALGLVAISPAVAAVGYLVGR
ncbi:hypothetical protein BH09ACT1_BH09ACT1_22970 [soil metagenome]